MSIPRIVHQLWKNDEIPAQWKDAVASVQRYHKGWEYRLWTDDMLDAYVRQYHPQFYPKFAGFNRHIMRVDVFRYILMQDFGGLYCDLDYEFVRPFDYGDAELVLSLEYDEAYGDDVNQVANYIFASAKGHPLWRDVLDDLERHPPVAEKSTDVCLVTGPWYLTTQFYKKRYEGVRLTPKPVLSPRRVHGRYERKFYVNSGVTHGFHYGWGSWRDRMNWDHWRQKLGKWFGARRGVVTP